MFVDCFSLLFFLLDYDKHWSVHNCMRRVDICKYYSSSSKLVVIFVYGLSPSINCDLFTWQNKAYIIE